MQKSTPLTSWHNKHNINIKPCFCLNLEFKHYIQQRSWMSNPYQTANQIEKFTSLEIETIYHNSLMFHINALKLYV